MIFALVKECAPSRAGAGISRFLLHGLGGCRRRTSARRLGATSTAEANEQRGGSEILSVCPKDERRLIEGIEPLDLFPSRIACDPIGVPSF
jgi:hypothetical protein